MRKVRITAIQPYFPEVLEHETEGIEHALKLLHDAAKENPDIVCFPECYPFWEREEIFTAARELRCYVIAGTVQQTGTKEYCTMILIDRKGKLVGRQRKCHRAYSVEPFAVDEEAYHVFDTEFGKIGIAICLDGWGFPEGFYQLAKGGAEIIFNPSLIFRKKPQRRIGCITRILEYRIPIVSVSNARWAFKRKPEDVPLSAAGGGSLILSPPEELSDLKLLAEWVKTSVSTEDWIVHESGEEEEIVTVTLDLDALSHLREVWDDCFGKTRLI